MCMYEKLFHYQEEVFKVIANQKRLEIIQLLTHGELSVSEMVEMLGISQSNVSQHLSLLRRSQIVRARKDGKTIYYCLKDSRIAEACSLIRQFLIEENRVEDAKILDEGVESLYPLIQDPVCGMRMALSEASDHHQFEGRRYYFCAQGCKSKFKAHPLEFVEHVESK